MRFRAIAFACAFGLSLAASAHAQVFDSVGTRAMGMGGAFTAVADDATATYWNPAGLVNGPLVDAALQRAFSQSPRTASLADPSGYRVTTTFFAFALPSLGVNYLRIRTLQSLSPTAPGSESRQQQRPGVAVVSAFSIDELGGTLVQSVTSSLVVGTTLKIVHGSFVSAAANQAGESMDAGFGQAQALTAAGKTKFDIDVGVLGWAGPVRFGLAGRNLTRPNFGARLERQVRAGVALTPGFVVGRTIGAQPSLTFSVDADLTRYLTPLGRERRVAAGAERWLMNRRLALRAGVNANTTGQARAVAAAGASFAVRSGFVVEGQIARGRETAGKSWSIGGRVSY